MQSSYRTLVNDILFAIVFITSTAVSSATSRASGTSVDPTTFHSGSLFTDSSITSSLPICSSLCSSSQYSFHLSIIFLSILCCFSCLQYLVLELSYVFSCQLFHNYKFAFTFSIISQVCLMCFFSCSIHLLFL